MTDQYVLMAGAVSGLFLGCVFRALGLIVRQPRKH